MTHLQNKAFPYSEHAQQAAIWGGSCVLESVLFFLLPIAFLWPFPSNSSLEIPRCLFATVE